MKENNVIRIMLGIFFTGLVFAGDEGTWRLMSALSSGPTWSDPGKTQTIYVQPELPETFAAHSTTTILGDGEIFLGMQNQLAQYLKVQLGLAFGATTAIPLNGDVWQDADPNFNNLSYKYKIDHAQVAVKGKLLTHVYQWVQPYIAGSFGVGFNHAYQYSIRSNLFEVLSEPPFAAQTTTAFSYTLGVGLQRALNKHWSIGLGYEFADWGKTSLREGTGQFSNAGLNLNHVYTNELQFSLSFVV